MVETVPGTVPGTVLRLSAIRTPRANQVSKYPLLISSPAVFCAAPGVRPASSAVCSVVFWRNANSSFAVDPHSLRAAGLAFELKSKGWIMRDLAVHMGPHGLGLQLDVRHGGVKVDGLTPTPPGVSNSAQVWHGITWHCMAWHVRQAAKAK